MRGIGQSSRQEAVASWYTFTLATPSQPPRCHRTFNRHGIANPEFLECVVQSTMFKCLGMPLQAVQKAAINIQVWEVISFAEVECQMQEVKVILQEVCENNEHTSTVTSLEGINASVVDEQILR